MLPSVPLLRAVARPCGCGCRPSRPCSRMRPQFLISGRARQITNSWATPRTSISKSRPCTAGAEAQMREAEMVGPEVSAISPSGGRVVADRYPTTLAAGEVAPGAVMSLAALGSTLAVDRLRLGKTKPGSACKSPSRRPCWSNASSARAAADRIVDDEIPRLGLSIMLTDRHRLLVSATPSAARDAYVEGCEAKQTMYPARSRRSIASSPQIPALPSRPPPRRTRCWNAGTRRRHARRCRTTVAEPIWENASGTAAYRDQVGCLGRD